MGVTPEINTKTRHSVLYLQYANPAVYPPLERSGLSFINAGWNISYFGIQSEGESNKLIFPPALAKYVVTWRNQSPGPRQKLHFLAFTLAALWKVVRHRPSWIYCSDIMSCPLAWLVKSFKLCRVLYHEHDSPEYGIHAAKNKQSRESDSNIPSFQRFLLWCRRKVGCQADLLILPNPKRLELFIIDCKRKKQSLVVQNCPLKEEICFKSRSPLSQSRLRLIFHGSINRNRLPMAMLPALAKLKDKVELQIVGYETRGSSDYSKQFLLEAKCLGIESQVAWTGAVPTRIELLKIASQADVGIAFMPLNGGGINMENMTGASNKPFDYLACGLALLVSARPDWEEMFVHPGYGLACDPFDADSIAGCLRYFLENRRDMQKMGESGSGQISRQWNYEMEFAPVIDLMSGLSS